MVIYTVFGYDSSLPFIENYLIKKVKKNRWMVI